MDMQGNFRCVSTFVALHFSILFNAYFKKGKNFLDHKCTLQVEEIYNFSQDDLLTEDMMILDTHVEVFVWVGQSVDPKEKQSAFEIGQVL